MPTSGPRLEGALIGLPSTDHDVIRARSLITKHIRQVYMDFVCEGHFMFTDVFDRNCGLLTTPAEDPMGVVAAATAIMRYHYADAYAKNILRPGMYMELSSDVRHYMAAALFLAYKAKSEDTWSGGMMTRAVLARFVTDLEYPNDESRMRMARFVMQAEVNLLKCLPILSLVDGNIHGVVERQLSHLMQTNLLTPTACMAVLSCMGYYYHHVTAVNDTEAVEELCTTHGMNEVASAFVQIGALSIPCATTFKAEDVPDHRLCFSAASTQCALRIVQAVVHTDFDRTHLPSSSVHLQAMTCRLAVLTVKARLENAMCHGKVRDVVDCT